VTSVLLLFSGGLDSSTLLAKLIADKKRVHPVFMGYGQKHSRAEQAAALRVAGRYGVTGNISYIDLPVLKDSGSALIDPTNEMPHRTYEELQMEIGPSPTYVPFRNGIFLSYATALALMNHIDEVSLAVHASDYSNWAYPDCSPEFIGPMSSAVYIGTYLKVRVTAPFLHMTKSEIVKLGTDLKVPYELTWSCYTGGIKPCRECPTCVERAHAFEENGLVDPLLVD